MNKTELKNFAVNARRELLKQVSLRANLFGIAEKTGLTIEERFGQLMINGNPYPTYMKLAFLSLQKQLEQKGYEQVLEEVAYTWFNRIIAIRYMEIHDYLPERVNVLSSSTGRVDPDILTEYETMELPIDKVRVKELLTSGLTEEAYRQLFIAQCNELNKILPFMFEKIHDYTELLLPDYLLDNESIINVLVKNGVLTESFQEIEVIGWLYQYYIAEEKNRVFKQKSKYKKEEIPYATQLFTPKWIVQYMVQNSLGRYWTEAHPEHEDLIKNWEYFIEHKEEDFKKKIELYVNKELKVEDIKCFDPAMGSGHILVYIFDLLHEIYIKCGYPEREIPRLILENNLYGLDIDDRAYQLACFSVIMKATQYNKRFLRSIERKSITLKLASIQETNTIPAEVFAYIADEDEGVIYNQVQAFFNQYHNAKIYGSLININERELSFLENRLQQLKNKPVHDLFQSDNHEIAIEILPKLINQTKIMRNVYDIVVMNPPYMGAGNMGKELSDFLKKKYPDSKSDLFAAFMEVNHYIKKNSFYAAINQHSWMFLSSYERLREKVITNKFIDSMLHLGPRAFEDIGGEVVQSTAFVLRESKINSGRGIYLRLVDERVSRNKSLKTIQAIEDTSVLYRYVFNQDNFKKIPGNPVTYWISDRLIKIYEEYPKLGELVEPRQGMATSDNDRFLRKWYEVSLNKIGFNMANSSVAVSSRKKWFPFNKGGKFRKWYGNNEYVVNYENDGEELKEFADELNKTSPGGRIKNQKYYFMEGITWSKISSNSLSVRYSDQGFIFSDAGMKLFASREELYYYLALLNSSITEIMIKQLSSTLNFEQGNISRIPVVKDTSMLNKINPLVLENIKISKQEWDQTEISWDFLKHPLLNFQEKTLSKAYEKLVSFSESEYKRLKFNEKEINEIFISSYALKNEVLSENLTDEITLPQLNSLIVAKSLLSYIIGCIVGRYSLDLDGLVFAGGGWNNEKYSSFVPNKYGIVQFTDAEYFEHDIIARLRQFLAVAFCADAVDENVQWLAKSLEIKKGEDAEGRLRRYFLEEFFADHCKTYQKRPIYWLVDSGKQKGLRTLVYMHRYQPDTMATIRFEYLQEIQAKYNHEIDSIDMRLVNPNLNVTEKRNLEKQKLTFKKRLEELLEFDKRLAEYANAQIPIDLDEGVVANYAKFDGVLGKIK